MIRGPAGPAAGCGNHAGGHPRPRLGDSATGRRRPERPGSPGRAAVTLDL